MPLTRLAAPTRRRVSTHTSRPNRWERRAGQFVFAAVVLGLAMITVLVTATAAAAAEPIGQVAVAGSVNAVLTNIRNWIMGILAILATVFLTIGGVRYVVAAGDPGEVEKAKTAFKSAAVGYGLAALAPLVVSILKGFVGA